MQSESAGFSRSSFGAAASSTIFIFEQRRRAFHGTLARLQRLQTLIFQSFLSKLEHSNCSWKWKFSSRHVDDQISPVVNSEQRYILRMTPKALGSVRTSILRHLKFSNFYRQIVTLDGAFPYHKCNYISIWPHQSTRNDRRSAGKVQRSESNGLILSKIENTRVLPQNVFSCWVGN